MSFKFKNTGQDLDEIRKRLSNEIKILDNNKLPIGIRTPLRRGMNQGETLFSMHFDPLDQISDNLRNLIMTQKGERLGRGDFGTNLYKIYSKTNIENPDQLAIEEIKKTVKLFMPMVSLKDFESKIINNGPNDSIIYNINIFYEVPSIGKELKSISINLKMTN